MPSSNSGHTGTNTRHSGLHYVYPGGRGYQRIKKGENFEYLGLSGKALTNRRIIKRIESLKIPPAWEKVWICSDPGGHPGRPQLEKTLLRFIKKKKPLPN